MPDYRAYIVGPEARRAVTPSLDPMSRERIGRLISDLEGELAAIKKRADTSAE